VTTDAAAGRSPSRGVELPLERGGRCVGIKLRVRVLVVAVAVLAGPLALTAEADLLDAVTGDLDQPDGVQPVGDLDGDGLPDAVTIIETQEILIVQARRGRDGKLLWEHEFPGAATVGAAIWVTRSASTHGHVFAARIGEEGVPGVIVAQLTRAGAYSVAGDVEEWDLRLHAVGGDGTVHWRQIVPGIPRVAPTALPSIGGAMPYPIGVFNAIPGDASDLLVRMLPQHQDGTADFIVIDGTDGEASHNLFAYETYFPKVETVGDLSGDGLDDFVAYEWFGEEVRVTALRGDGNQVWQTVLPVRMNWLAVGDAGDGDGDGRVEILLAGSPINHLLDGATGTVRWAEPGSAFAAGDVDGDGLDETLLGTSSGTTATLVAIDFTGTERYSRAHAIGSTLVAFYAVGDVNGDGAVDVLHSSYTGGETYENGLLDGTTGDRIWLQQRSPARLQPTGGPIDGSGDDLFYVQDEPDGTDTLVVVSGATGAEWWSANLGGWWWGKPLVADVEGDGAFDVFVSPQVGGEGGGCVEPTCLVQVLPDGAIRVPTVLAGADGTELWSS
jgi:hypothetical protein